MKHFAPSHLLDQGTEIPMALGSDLAPFNVKMGTILSHTLGLSDVLVFAEGNSLERLAPRLVFKKTCPHITLAFRLLPVFNEQKIRVYLRKISQELGKEDFFIISIALPEGRSYEENMQRSREGRNIPPTSTTFGGTTFFYKPNFGNASDDDVAKSLSQQFNINIQPEDISKVVTNTYMTASQAKKLFFEYGLKIVNQQEVICEDGNKRLVISMQKI